MHTMNAKALIRFLVSVAIELNMPTMVWGQPGAGKSQCAAQVARQVNGFLVDIRTSQYDSVDFRGLPTMVNGTTVWNLPSTLPFKGNPNFPTDRPIILFLDEINSGSPSVLAVCYQLVLDRRVGEHVLMDNVYVIAAGNREGDKGVTNKMPLPLANRFIHVELGVDDKAVIEHFTSISLPAEIVAFLSFRSPLISTFDPSRTDKAFATPRSWEAAARVFASSIDVDLKKAAMSGAIGEGPTTEFWAFVDSITKVIPISTIIADPHRAPLPDEASMRYATAVSISGWLSPKNSSALHTYLCRMDPEFLILAWQYALKRDKELLTTNEFVLLSKEYREIFKS